MIQETAFQPVSLNTPLQKGETETFVSDFPKMCFQCLRSEF